MKYAIIIFAFTSCQSSSFDSRFDLYKKAVDKETSDAQMYMKMAEHNLRIFEITKDRKYADAFLRYLDSTYKHVDKGDSLIKAGI